MRYRYLSVFFCIILLNAQPLAARPLAVGVTHLPPFYVVEPDGRVSGVLADLIKRTLNDAKIPYLVESYPPKRLYENVVAGVTEVTVGIKVGLFSEIPRVIYSQWPVASIELKVYALKSTPLPKKTEDLFGFSVGLIRGFQYGDRRALLNTPENGPFLLDLNTHENALSMLLSGRIDYLLDYKESISSVIKQNQTELTHNMTLQNLMMFFTVSKATPNAEKLMKTLENSYQNIRQVDE